MLSQRRLDFCSHVVAEITLAPSPSGLRQIVSSLLTPGPDIHHEVLASELGLLEYPVPNRTVD